MIFCVCLHTALNQYQVRPRGWLTVVSPLQVPSCYHTSSCWCSAASPSSSSSCPSVSLPARGVWEYGRSAPCSKVSVSMFVQSAYREQIHYMVIWGFWLGQGLGGGARVWWCITITSMSTQRDHNVCHDSHFKDKFTQNKKTPSC